MSRVGAPAALSARAPLTSCPEISDRLQQAGSPVIGQRLRAARAVPSRAVPSRAAAQIVLITRARDAGRIPAQLMHFLAPQIRD